MKRLSNFVWAFHTSRRVISRGNREVHLYRIFSYQLAIAYDKCTTTQFIDALSGYGEAVDGADIKFRVGKIAILKRK